MSDAHHASDSDRRSALERGLVARLRMLSYDELRVVDVITDRILRVGRDSYAPLDLARDPRDWRAEAAAELADQLFYGACHEVASNDRRLERLRCEVADEVGAAIDRGLAELRDVRIDLDVGEPHDVGGES